MYKIDNKVYAAGPVSWIEQTGGSSLDWAKNFGIEYTYAIELRDEGEFAFELPAELIDVTAQEAKAATFVFARHVADSTVDGEENDINEDDKRIENEIEEKTKLKGKDSVKRQNKVIGFSLN